MRSRLRRSWHEFSSWGLPCDAVAEQLSIQSHQETGSLQASLKTPAWSIVPINRLKKSSEYGDLGNILSIHNLASSRFESFEWKIP